MMSIEEFANKALADNGTCCFGRGDGSGKGWNDGGGWGKGAGDGWGDYDGFGYGTGNGRGSGDGCGYGNGLGSGYWFWR